VYFKLIIVIYYTAGKKYTSREMFLFCMHVWELSEMFVPSHGPLMRCSFEFVGRCRSYIVVAVMLLLQLCCCSVVITVYIVVVILLHRYVVVTVLLSQSFVHTVMLHTSLL